MMGLLDVFSKGDTGITAVVGLDKTKFDRGITDIGGSLSRLNQSGGRAVLGLAAGVTVAATAIGALVKNVANTGDFLDKMSQRTQTTVKFLEGLKFASELSGSSLSSMEIGIKKIQMSANDAKNEIETYTDAFGDLGIEVTDTKGELKDTETIFLETATALSKMENGTQKAALASKLFGRSGTALLPMLTQGKKGIEAMFQESEKLSNVWDKNTTKQAAFLNDELSRMERVVGGVKDEIGIALLPIMTRLTTQTREWLLESRNSGEMKKGIEDVTNAAEGLLIVVDKIVSGFGYLYSFGESLSPQNVARNLGFKPPEEQGREAFNDFGTRTGLNIQRQELTSQALDAGVAVDDVARARVDPTGGTPETLHDIRVTMQSIRDLISNQANGSTIQKVEVINGGTR